MQCGYYSEILRQNPDRALVELEMLYHNRTSIFSQECARVFSDRCVHFVNSTAEMLSIFFFF